MSTNPTHPALLYFGNTLELNCQLVLMMGREPNTDYRIVSGAGPYDFREYPKAAFWNIAYGLVAQSVQMTGAKLKQVCIHKNASPILFANSLPIGIKSSVDDKLQDRRKVTTESAQNHVRSVFALDDFISRVRIVIMSGLSENVFDASRRAIRIECDSRSIHVAEVPFFFGPNKAKIDAVLTDFDRVRLREVASGFIK